MDVAGALLTPASKFAIFGSSIVHSAGNVAAAAGSISALVVGVQLCELGVGTLFAKRFQSEAEKETERSKQFNLRFLPDQIRKDETQKALLERLIGKTKEPSAPPLYTIMQSPEFERGLHEVPLPALPADVTVEQLEAQVRAIDQSLARCRGELTNLAPTADRKWYRFDQLANNSGKMILFALGAIAVGSVVKRVGNWVESPDVIAWVEKISRSSEGIGGVSTARNLLEFGGFLLETTGTLFTYTGGLSILARFAEAGEWGIRALPRLQDRGWAGITEDSERAPRVTEMSWQQIGSRLFYSVAAIGVGSGLRWFASQTSQPQFINWLERLTSSHAVA